MLRWFRDRNPSTATALELYGSSVAQARQPVFYRKLCVADTFSGRFELVMLHVSLLVRRLTAEGDAGSELGRALVERMFTMLDDDMRELGIGDLSVAKKVQTAAGSFYGRLKAYDGALGQPDNDELTETLRRNVPAITDQVVSVDLLATYVRDAANQLAAQRFAELQLGLAQFPKPLEA